MTARQRVECLLRGHLWVFVASLTVRDYYLCSRCGVKRWGELR